MAKLLKLMALLLCTTISLSSKLDHPKLSESYLPVAMQVIAHLTDQMAYDRDDPLPPKPSTGTATSTSSTTTKTPKPTTSYRPGGWSFSYSTVLDANKQPVSTVTSYRYPINKALVTIAGKSSPLDLTTPFHAPGLVAPLSPPPLHERKGVQNIGQGIFLLPVQSSQSIYSVIGPHRIQSQTAKESLLSPNFANDQIHPIVDQRPESNPLLPLEEFEPVDLQGRASGFDLSDKSNFWDVSEEELDDNNLQYLSSDVKDILKLVHDADDERAIVFEVQEDKQTVESGSKAKPKPKPISQSNVRLQLLYDLLSREAKRQKFTTFQGYSPALLTELSESWSGGARAQLRHVLSRMLARGDCAHEYANNRAREMNEELAKDESVLSSEVRYLQPLVFSL